MRKRVGLKSLAAAPLYPLYPRVLGPKIQTALAYVLVTKYVNTAVPRAGELGTAVDS